MVQFGEGRPDDAQAERRPDAQAEIDVVEGDGEVLRVHPAHRLVDGAAQRQAGRGDGGGAPRRGEQALRPGIVAPRSGEQVVGDADAEHRAAMLQPAAGVEQPGADRADLRPHGAGDHLRQPVGGDDVDVVVEQQQDLAARLGRGAVVQRGEVERAGRGQDAQARVAAQAVEQGVGRRRLAAVVHHQHFERGVGGAVQQPVEAAFEQRGAVARRHDDGDQGERVGPRPADARQQREAELLATNLGPEPAETSPR